MALLLTGLLFYILLPTDFRKAFFNPATSGERLLVRSLGLVAVVALIAEVAIGHSPDNGINGISPCLFLGFTAVWSFTGGLRISSGDGDGKKRQLQANGRQVP